jgi:hypothetical protein
MDAGEIRQSDVSCHRDGDECVSAQFRPFSSTLFCLSPPFCLSFLSSLLSVQVLILTSSSSSQGVWLADVSHRLRSRSELVETVEGRIRRPSHHLRRHCHAHRHSSSSPSCSSGRRSSRLGSRYSFVPLLPTFPSILLTSSPSQPVSSATPPLPT